MVGKALAALTNSKLGVGTQACLEPWVGNPKPNPNPTLTGMVPLPMTHLNTVLGTIRCRRQKICPPLYLMKKGV
jgi:hypothetical protein